MSDWSATKVGLNSFVKSLVGMPYRKLVRDSWLFSKDDFWNYQKKRFHEVYAYARAYVPYYQERIHLYPPFEENYNLLEFLSQLPLINKQTLRKHNKQFWSARNHSFIRYHSTSGTSGTPLKLRATLSEKGLAQAISEEWMLHLTGDRRPRTLYLSGFLTPSREDALAWYDRIWGHTFLSIYSLSESNFRKIAEIVEKARPQVIFGYASAVYQLARLFRDRCYIDKDECVAVVTSEVLQPDWREAIESVLCRKAYNLYGSQEGSHRVYQSDDNHLHIEPISGIVEILDDHNNQSPIGEVGRVIVTGLIRTSMPLIRYDIGDAAVCTGYAVPETGLQWPTIGHIQGRSEDLIRTRDGRLIGMLSYSAIKNIRGIRESQIVQVEYDKFVINIVLDENELASKVDIESEIYSQFLKRIGNKIAIEFRYVSEIPRSSRGKFKAVKVAFEDD